ncbi:MAG: hypothetical protein ACXABY_37040 [Candidatus Thorarchaeota archaeon]|jgi:hypothetical protein
MIVHIRHKDDDTESVNLKILCRTIKGWCDITGDTDEFTWWDSRFHKYNSPPTCTACVLLALSEPETVAPFK